MLNDRPSDGHSAASTKDAANACEREAIRTPNAIQADGVILVSDQNGLVTHASANVDRLFGLAAEDLLATRLATLLPASFTATIGEEPREVGRLPSDDAENEWRVMAHRRHDWTIHEFLPEPRAFRAVDFTTVAVTLSERRPVAEFADRLCETFRIARGFDRVMVYQFDTDWHGRVIAESKADELEPYRGLNYPASDIPSQARDLYLEAVSRVLTDANEEPIPVIGSDRAGRDPVDFSRTILRAMSPLHREYLRNMGVRATLVTSIVRAGRLWGLIAAHHRTPRRADAAAMQSLESAARLLATAIDLDDAHRRTKGIAFTQDLLRTLPHALSDQQGLGTGLVDPKTGLMEFFQADGLVVVHRGHIRCRGIVPEKDRLSRLLERLEAQADRMVVTDCLSEWDSTWTDNAISGLLALSIPNCLQGWVICFRLEQTKTVTWAGDPRKAMIEGDGDEPRLSPRRSFAAWTETIRGRSRPWSDFERETAADVIRPNLLEVLTTVTERNAEGIRRYQSILFDQVHDCIIVTDLVGIVTFWNDGATRTLGWTAEEMVGRPILDRIPERDRELAGKIYREVTEGKPFSGRYRDTHKDGHKVWLDIRLRRIHDEHGRPIGVMGASRDVTAERDAEAMLRLQREILRHASDNIILTEAEPLDLPGPKIIYVNDSVLRSTGYTREELIGQTPRIFQGPSTDRDTRERIRIAMKTWQPIREELINYRKDGTEYWIELDLTPLADETGWYTHWIGIQRDITARKKAEVELREREKAFRSLAEQSPDPVFVLHLNDSAVPLRILYTNPAVRLTHGYEPSEMIGRSILDFDSPQDREHAPDRIARIVGGETVLFEVRHRDRLGRFLPMEVRATRIDWNGRPAALALNRDIRERKQAEELSRRNQTYLRNVIDAIPALLCARDKDGRITMVNRACAEAFGLPPESLVGLLDNDIPTAPRPVNDDCNHLELPNDSQLHEIEFRLATGERRWLAIAKSALPNSDGEQSLCVATDITRSKQLEEQNRQNQKLEAIGQLAGGVAHDFNNLLTIIRGNVDLLLDMFPTVHPSREFLEPVLRAAERGAGLTRQLLAFGRQQMVRIEPLPVNEAVRETLTMLGRLLGEDVTVETILDDRAPMVLADAGQFEQILINLAVNARDAMPTGGCLTVSTDIITKTADDSLIPDAVPREYAVLSVADSGIGIPLEIRSRLFEPFFTTKPAGQGTGLGLATVYGIVRQLNGFITVDSDLGLGTQFTIHLPLHRPTVDAVALAELNRHHSSTTIPPRSATVLIVEDDDAIRTLATLILERAGYRVLAAESGEAALRVCDVQTPDVVMTDIVMPGMNGRELAEHLLGRCPDVRVIYLSGYTADTVVRYGVEHENVSFLQKPYTPTALTNLLADVLAGR